jgi:hypothetical protein
LIIIVLFCQQARSMLYFESIIFDPEYGEGSICTSHADIFLSLPPLDIILTMKVVAPDKSFDVFTAFQVVGLSVIS